MADYGWSLSEATVRKAREELHENPEEYQESIKAMRDLMATRPDVGFLRSDDVFLLRFLRARKFNIQAAFQLYTRYFEYRQRNKNLFRKFNASEAGVKQALLDGFPGVLASPDHQGRRILVIFTSNWDHNRYSLVSIYRALLLSLEKLLEDEETQINGFIIIIDWSGFTFRQSSHMNPKVLKLIIEGLQDCFPGRFSGIHFINQPWYVEAVLTVIKPFLKEKTKQKVFMHGNNLTILHLHIPKDVLPAELGGSGPPYNIEYWAKQLIGDEFFAFSDRHIFWPHHNEMPTSSPTTTSKTPRSETFPSNSYKGVMEGRPSVTELDEDFFLSD